jgi:hypothetical protein
MRGEVSQDSRWIIGEKVRKRNGEGCEQREEAFRGDGPCKMTGEIMRENARPLP